MLISAVQQRVFITFSFVFFFTSKQIRKDSKLHPLQVTLTKPAACLPLQQSDPAWTMAVMQTPGGPSPGQTCVLILIFTVLLQALCVALTYVYFTNELKQVGTMYTFPDRGSQPPSGFTASLLAALWRFYKGRECFLSLPGTLTANAYHFWGLCKHELKWLCGRKAVTDGSTSY